MKKPRRPRTDGYAGLSVDPFLANELIVLGCAMTGSTLFVIVRSVLQLRDLGVRRAWRCGCEALNGGRNEDAETWFRRSTAIATRCFGANDRRTAAHASLLARALVALKRTDEATTLVDRALAAIEKHAGVADPMLAVVEISAAALARGRGDSRAAVEHLERARIHSRRDPGSVAAIDLERAALLEHLGDPRGASEVLRGVAPRFILTYSPSLALPLARGRLTEGDAAGAAAIYSQLVERERRHGPESTTLACYRGLAGDALHRAGKHAEARYALMEAIATYDASKPPAEIAAAPLLVVLARTHLALGDSAAAEAACRRALAIAANASGSGDPYRDPSEPDPLASVREEARLLLVEVILPR
jgi:tetratricopeptide (TPR) repeat protein